MNRSVVFNLRFPADLLDQIEKITEDQDNKFKSISEAIRYYIKIGILIESYKLLIKDPAFLESIEQLKQGDRIFHWSETLEDQHLDALMTALKMEKDRRYSNGSFR